MKARNETVLRAISKSLRVNQHVDMDAFATSYELPEQYRLSKPKGRAAMLIEAIIRDERRGEP